MLDRRDDLSAAVTQRQIDALCQSRPRCFPNHDPVHDRFDSVRRADVQGLHLIQFHDDAVDPRTHIACLADQFKNVETVALSFPHDRCQEHHARPFRIGTQRVEDLLRKLWADRTETFRTDCFTETGIEKTQIIVDLRHGRDGTARITDPRVLVDGNGRLKSFDPVHIRAFHLMKKLTGIYGKAFDVLPLTFCVQRVERQRTLPRTARSRDDDEPVSRNIDTDVLQIVHSSANDLDPLFLMLNAN